jgi:hypothetical protein
MSGFRHALASMVPLVVRQGLLALVFVGTIAGETHKQSDLTPEQADVLKPLQNLLDGVAKCDKDEVRNQLLFLPGGTATLIRNGKILQLSFDAFLARIPTGRPEPVEERLQDPQIFIDDDIAVIWAPYQSFANGVLDHWGTDVVHLVRQDGRWLITSLGDNSRKTGLPR